MCPSMLSDFVSAHIIRQVCTWYSERPYSLHRFNTHWRNYGHRYATPKTHMSRKWWWSQSVWPPCGQSAAHWLADPRRWYQASDQRWCKSWGGQGSSPPSMGYGCFSIKRLKDVGWTDGKNWTWDLVELNGDAHHSPFEDVLGDVGRGRGVPLNGVGVGLVSRFTDNHLHRTLATWKGDNPDR